MYICDKCGKSFEKGKFCTSCGGPIREFFTVKQTDARSEALTCNKCGKTSSGGKFCIFCGGELGSANSAGKSSQPVGASVPNGVQTAGSSFASVPNGTQSARPNSASASTAQPTVGASAAAPDNSARKNEAAGMVCSKCGKTFEKGKFCTSCGGDLVPANSADKPSQPAPAPVPTNAPPARPVTAQAPTAQPPVNAAPAAPNSPTGNSAGSGMVCSNCGKSFEKGKFCTVCGGTLVSANGGDREPALVGAAVSSTANAAFKTTDSVGSAAEKIPEIPIKPPPAPVDPTAASGGSGSLRCESCGKTFDKGKFCTSCGGALVSANGAASAAPKPAPAAPTSANFSTEGGRLRCTSCGNIMAKGKFCTSCGGSLAPMDGAVSAHAAPASPVSRGMHCPKCGKTFESGKFCTVCGIALVN